MFRSPLKKLEHGIGNEYSPDPPVRDQDRLRSRRVLVPRSNSDVRPSFDAERPTPGIGGIEFDPGSYPRLSPESVITDPPLAFLLRWPSRRALGEGGSVAPKRNQEERRERCTARRVHCSSEPGGVRGSRERSPPRHPVASE